MVLVGRIARAHGLRGQVLVAPETDFVQERFAPGATVWTRSSSGDETLVITSARLQGGRAVVGFDGFDTIDAVERLVGQELRVPLDRLAPLEPHTYYHHELIGCVVETIGDAQVGTVTAVQGGAAGSLLVVAGARGEILVPLARDICVAVDVEAKRIRIAPPAGLLDLNEKRTVNNQK